MIKKVSIIAVAILACLLVTSAASAQRNRPAALECSGRVFQSSQVSRPAKLITRPDFSNVMDVFRGVQGRVKIDAVLCRSGRVTDVKVLEAPTAEVNDFVGQAVRLVEFRPAELNWHSVSQAMQFEFEVGNDEIKLIPPAPANSAVVEIIDVVGNRRLTAKEILGSVQTRAGERYNEAQVRADLESLLATGKFDKTQTRVVAEPSVRGGLNLHFVVTELPVVGEIKFEGLTLDEARARQALKHAGLQPGAPYTPQVGQAGVQVLRRLLLAGEDYPKVDLRTDFKDFQTVNLVFVINKP